MVEQVTSTSLQLHGANGYQQGHALEYLYRLARGRQIVAGTDEIQKNQIAAAVKRDGLPDLAYDSCFELPQSRTRDARSDPF